MVTLDDALEALGSGVREQAATANSASHPALLHVRCMGLLYREAPSTHPAKLHTALNLK
jgi:hypothetical protein